MSAFKRNAQKLTNKKIIKMKKGLLFMFAAVAFVAFSFTNVIVQTLKVDVSKSEITWTASKVTGTHNGTVAVKEGSLEMTDGVLTGGSFEVDMTSLIVTDLEGEWKGKLEGHLKSEDFFGIEKYPTAKLVITKVAAKGTPGDYKVYGDLTIKETTEPISFYANVVENVATATLEIDRSKYDVKYGSGSFFAGLGDKTIYDEFELQVKLVVE